MKMFLLVCLVVSSVWTGSLDAENSTKSTMSDKKRGEILKELKESSQLPLGKYKNVKEQPTKCHVCRVMVQELLYEMRKTDDIRRSYQVKHRLDEQKKIDYKTSEIRIHDILDVVCNNVVNYRSITGPEFPYLRDVKSTARTALENAMKESGLSVKLDAPEEVLADPSSEIRRMYQLCNQMVEEHEDDILDWYKHAQDGDPVEFICAERVVDSDEQDCLIASTEMPDDSEQEEIRKFTKDEKRNFKFESSHKEL